MMGNDDTASPTTGQRLFVVDYFSLVWNPNLLLCAGNACFDPSSLLLNVCNFNLIRMSADVCRNSIKRRLSANKEKHKCSLKTLSSVDIQPQIIRT